MKQLGFIVGVMMSLMMMGCQHDNPTLRLSSDEFAQLVNQFDSTQDTLFNYSAPVCGDAFQATNKTHLLKQIDADTQADCEKTYFPKLLAFLKRQTPKLGGLSILDLKQPATWHHYFASRYAKGQGMRW